VINLDAYCHLEVVVGVDWSPRVEVVVGVDWSPRVEVDRLPRVEVERLPRVEVERLPRVDVDRLPRVEVDGLYGVEVNDTELNMTMLHIEAFFWKTRVKSVDIWCHHFKHFSLSPMFSDYPSQCGNEFTKLCVTM
jgi:hypothetical protein